jgi:phosphoesterase RecJ-like protein
MRALLTTLERTPDGIVAHWELRDQTRIDLELRPEDSEGLIDVIRAIRGVQLALFFEELPDGKIRVSMRSKDRKLDVCRIATEFGGGGHALAAGIRMKGPLEVAKARVLDAVRRRVDEVKNES